MAQCIVVGPVCLFVGGRVCVFVGGCECYHDNSKYNACIDPHQTVFVDKDSDCLQLIKFWPSRAPRKGICGGAKKFGSTLLQPAHSVFISLNAFFRFICTSATLIRIYIYICISYNFSKSCQ